jgi:alkanesulfonate monooxygenase SsuD/methylene tetrahydromethanopterin reductase-like flavin-dependent oxidoreductase (luciferase family)
MQLGVSVEIQEGMGYGDVLDLVRAAEAAGFQTALLAEHYVPSGVADRYPGGFRGTMSPDAWVFLAALARDTGRIRLGTLVSPVTFRHPSVLAKMAATLDHVSGGRAELGIGAGWLEAEHAAYGFPFPDGPRRVDLVEEQLRVITGLWTQDPFSHQGTHYQLADCHFTPVPEQRPHLPVLVGGQAASKRLPRLAVRYATDYVLTFASAEQCRAVRSTLDDLCRANGRDPASLRLALFTAVCVGATTAEVDARLAELRATNPQYEHMLHNLPTWLKGTPAAAAGQLRELEAAGVERVFLAVNSDLHRQMVPLLAQAATG